MKSKEKLTEYVSAAGHPEDAEKLDGYRLAGSLKSNIL